MRFSAVVLVVPLVLLCAWPFFSDDRPVLEDFQPNGNRALIIGLDGVDNVFLDAMLASGRMPELDSRRERVSRCDVHGPPPIAFLPVGLHPPRSWTLMATGISPEENGITDLSVPDRDDYPEYPISSVYRKAPTFWEFLSHFGLRSAVVGWWATWPADAVRGSLVSDRFFLDRFDVGPYSSHGFPLLRDPPRSYGKGAEALTYPDELADSLDATLQPVRTTPDPFLVKLRQLRDREQDPDRRRHLDQLQSAVERDLLVIETTKTLIDGDDLDCATCYLSSLLVALPYFWKYSNPSRWRTHPEPRVRAQVQPEELNRYGWIIPSLLQLLDREVARLYQTMGEDAFLVLVSRNSFVPGPNYGLRTVCLNPLLEELGYLVRDENGEIDFSKTRCFDRSLQPFQPSRVLDMNFADDFPQGFVASVGGKERMAAWNQLNRAFLACEVDPPWLPPGRSARSKSLFFSRPERVLPGSSWRFFLYNGFVPGTQVKLSNGKTMGIDELFPRVELQAQIREFGAMWVVQPEGERGRGLEALPPIDVDGVASSWSLVPTVLALFGVPRMEVHIRPRYELMSLTLAEQSALAAVDTDEYLNAIGRGGRETELGRRHAELRARLHELGYLDVAKSTTVLPGD